MTDSTQQSEKASLTNRLKELVTDISPFIDNASEDQKQKLLSVLEDLRKSDRRKHSRRPCSITVNYSTNFPTLPDKHEPIELYGKVAWAMPEGIGVKFKAEDQDLEAMIESL